MDRRSSRALLAIDINAQPSEECKGPRKSTPRRRSCSSPGLLLGQRRKRKKSNMYGRSKSLDFEHGLWSTAPPLGLMTSRSCDFESSACFSPSTNSTVSSSRTPPSEKMRKMLESFGIHSPSSASETHRRSQSAQSRQDQTKATRKLCMLSQLPLGRDSKDDLLDDTPVKQQQPRSTPPIISSRSPQRRAAGVDLGRLHRTPPAIPDPFHVEAMSQFMDNPLGLRSAFSESSSFYVTPDASDPTVFQWEMPADSKGQNLDETLMGGSSTLKDHFSVSKSPYRLKNSTPSQTSLLAHKDTWACESCTFINAAKYLGKPVTRCGSCEMPRPSAASPPRHNYSSSAMCSSPCVPTIAADTAQTPGTGGLPQSRARRPVSARLLDNICKNDRKRRESASSVASAPSPCPQSDKGQELTPSTAKLKVLPQRPSKGRLRRQRSLRMSGFGGTCPASVKHQHVGDFPGVSKLRRRNTFSAFPSSSAQQDFSDAFFLKLVTAIKRQNVSLLAIDWDNTLLGIHTKSDWYGTAKELEMHIRPKFRKLVHIAHAEGIRISIVTFSEQLEMVREVLRIAFPRIESGPRPCIIRGNGSCDDWTVSEPHPDIPAELKLVGKVPHMLSAMEALPACVPRIPQRVVLIDDDHHNITTAMEAKFHTFWMNPERPNTLWSSMKLLFCQ